MHVLIADDDPSFRNFVVQALEGTEFLPVDVTLEPEALAMPNSIVILGGSWVAVQLAGLAGGNQAVLVAVDSEATDELERVLSGGADDVLIKPLPPETLLTQLRVAHHRLGLMNHAQSARGCLEDALANRLTGAVMVRGVEDGGAIHVHDAQISWVERRGQHISLQKLLSDGGVYVDAETCDAVLREARTLDRHFTRVLVDWNLCSESQARSAVRAYLMNELETLLELDKAAVMFSPYDPRRAGKLAFEYAEVVPPRRPQSGLMPVVRRQGLGAREVSDLAQTMFRTVRELEGCVATYLFDHAGTLLERDGTTVDPELAWHIVHMMRPSGRALTVEDEHYAHFARPVDGSAVLLVTFSLKMVNLGLARTSLAHAAAQACQAVHGLDVGERPAARGANREHVA